MGTRTEEFTYQGKVYVWKVRISIYTTKTEVFLWKQCLLQPYNLRALQLCTQLQNDNLFVMFKFTVITNLLLCLCLHCGCLPSTTLEREIANDSYVLSLTHILTTSWRAVRTLRCWCSERANINVVNKLPFILLIYFYSA